MNEITINLHIHSVYSDGNATHDEIARAALKTGLDAIITTDHNVYVQGLDGYHLSGKRQTLLLTGEEIHNQARDPQKNHLLVIGTRKELSTYADHPQTLIDHVRKAGGLSFIAHPIDPELPAFNEGDISWVDWDVFGFTGIELWNGFSELKTVVKGKSDALFYAFFPEYLPHGPLPGTLKIWDGLLAKGQRVVAVGGSDSHALQMSMGPLKRTIFPYEYHFSTINTHLLIPQPLTGNLETDQQMIYTALANGHAFVGNDLPAPTKGFRFNAHGDQGDFIMGDEISGERAVTLQVKLPREAECRLIHNGEVIKTIKSEALTHLVSQPGTYRVEAYLNYLGKRRGWIFSNPIYVKP